MSSVNHTLPSPLPCYGPLTEELRCPAEGQVLSTALPARLRRGQTLPRPSGQEGRRRGEEHIRIPPDACEFLELFPKMSVAHAYLYSGRRQVRGRQVRQGEGSTRTPPPLCLPHTLPACVPPTLPRPCHGAVI